MRKSLLAVGLSLAMVLTMATPAFAAISTDANKNADGVEVTAPGIPGTAQVAGESFNAATMNSAGGTTWQVANDDDAVKTAVDPAADINVWAKVVDSGSKVYKIDLAWGLMKFEFNSGSGQWNTTTHAYDSTGGTAAWTVNDYLENGNNSIEITNHSNNAVDATFTYKMTGTPFNDVNGVNNVVGNFFPGLLESKNAAKVLTGTYTDTNGTVNDAAVTGEIKGGKIILPTADAYNYGTTPPSSINQNQGAGARVKTVFFAFSGTPDAGKGKTLDTFQKVGVVTVTVATNNDLNVNQPPYVAVP